ncbi:hypothetical protein HDU81_010341 [Chytriomyces hyalinus]|nr:hypothetical protein HDU81_010341 [Chytriomyces hyalinus]
MPHHKQPFFKKPAPFIRCLVITAILIVATTLSLFFLIPRQPTITVTGVAVDTDGNGGAGGAAGMLQLNSLTSVTARLKMGIVITNNCWYDLTFQTLNFKATHEEYDHGNTPFANGSNSTDFIVPSRQSVNITYPFSITYDASKDDGFQFVKHVGLACVTSLLGRNGKVDVRVAVDAQFGALGIYNQWQHTNVGETVSC